MDSALVELHFGYDKRTFSKALLTKIPAFASVFEASPERDVFFVDRNAEKFDQVVSYALQSSLATAPLPKLSKSVLYEAEHYGFAPSDNESDAVEAKAEFLVESILKNSRFLFDVIGNSVALCKLPIYEKSSTEEEHSDFFFVSACGVKFWTTKTTLRNLSFFAGVVNGLFTTQYSGTRENPYHVDIPPEIFSRILERARDERLDLEECDWTFYELLGEVRPLQAPIPDIRDLQGRHYASTTNPNAGIMQLVAVGDEDAVLHVKFHKDLPSQATPWRGLPEKRTISSHQRQILRMNGPPMLLGRNEKEEPWTAHIIRYGDLVHHVFLEFSFPGIATPYSNADLVRLIDRVELSWNFQTIDVIYGYQMQQIASLNPRAPNLNGTNYVHLPFWFSEHKEGALNLIGLRMTEVRLSVYLKERAPFAKQALQLSAHVQYVFLDTDERDYYSLKQIGNWCHLHRSIIDILNPAIQSGEEVRRFEIRLRWGRQVPFFVFSLHRDNSHEESFHSLPDLVHFGFSLNGQALDAGSHDIANRINKWNSKVMYDEHLATYLISFSLDAFGFQPQGWLNCSRIDTIQLELVTSIRVGCVRVWGRHYNTLMTDGNGSGGFRWSN